MTLKQYAAIHLRVPRSGDSKIDAMILESRRADFAEAALPAIVKYGCEKMVRNLFTATTKDAFTIADAMLAEWEEWAEK
jgi:hypothetical protein